MLPQTIARGVVVRLHRHFQPSQNELFHYARHPYGIVGIEGTSIVYHQLDVIGDCLAGSLNGRPKG